MPATKSKLERKCEVCGNHFIAKTIYSKYCSKHCSEVASRQKKKQKKLEEQKQQLVSMIPDERPYISIPEAVAMFGISRDTIYRLIRKGKLPARSYREFSLGIISMERHLCLRIGLQHGTDLGQAQDNTDNGDCTGNQEDAVDALLNGISSDTGSGAHTVDSAVNRSCNGSGKRVCEVDH